MVLSAVNQPLIIELGAYIELWLRPSCSGFYGLHCMLIRLYALYKALYLAESSEFVGRENVEQVQGPPRRSPCLQPSQSVTTSYLHGQKKTMLIRQHFPNHTRLFLLTHFPHACHISAISVSFRRSKFTYENRSR